MKKVFITILLLTLTGCVGNSMLGDAAIDNIDTKVESIRTSEDNWVKANGKYKHIPRYQDGENEYSVTEYVTPDGSAGYQVIVYTPTSTISTGYGPEAGIRTWVITQNVTTTK